MLTVLSEQEAASLQMQQESDEETTALQQTGSPFAESYRQRLEKQGYRLIGKHSATKTCHWTKSAIKGGQACYKNKFYGIQSHQCVQMTTYLSCANFCNFCWRTYSPAHTEFRGEPDNPKMILDGAVAGQKKLIVGIKGHKHDSQKFAEAQFPKHFAISLTGEPILYPRMQEMIEYAHSRGSTTFVVCSGQFPEHMAQIWPTQLYLSVDAPNKELLKKIDRSVFGDYWERFLRSVDVLRKKREERVRTVMRITCVKGENMEDEEGYAQIVIRGNPMFLEVKGYMFVGSSRQRLSMSNMPMHEEVKAFGRRITEQCSYKFIDEEPVSRVCLFMKEDFKGRFLE